MFKIQKYWFKVKDMISVRGLILTTILVVFYLKYILPHNLYSIDVLDRHYLGIFSEKEPPVIKTTRETNYYKKNGLAFITPEELEEHNKHQDKLLSQGIDPW